MTVKQYRCVTDALSIRTQPSLGDSYRTGQALKFGDVISADDSTEVDSEGYKWLMHSRGWSAEVSLDGSDVYLIDNSLGPKDKVWGINLDPANPTANPSASKLAGTGWVRFVLQANPRRQNPAPTDLGFSFYDPLIDAFTQTGTKVLLVIIQDTYWGNGPWSNGGWDVYTTGYASTLTRIAQHFQGKVAAYEIWNEMDLSGQPTSIFIPPQAYGPLLLAAAKAIRQADPSASVISGGLVGSDPVGYMKQVKASIGNTLPVDAIGFHPYGKTPPNSTPFGWQANTLGSAINALHGTFGHPVWITEFGVPRVDVNNQALWPSIADYMLKSFQYIHGSISQACPVAVWFAWADSQDNAGIVHNDQSQKGPIFDTFFQNVRADKPGTSAPTPSAPTLTVVTNSPLRIRATPSLTANIVGLLQPGDQITVIEKTVDGPLLWAHHTRGWSVIKNGQTGEVYLA